MLAADGAADPLRLALAGVAADETTALLAESAEYQLELSSCVADPARDRAKLDAMTKRRRQTAEQLMKLAKFQRKL